MGTTLKRWASSALSKIDVVEPSTEDSIKILNGLKQYFEEHHKIKYSMNVLKPLLNLQTSTFMIENYRWLSMLLMVAPLKAYYF